MLYQLSVVFLSPLRHLACLTCCVYCRKNRTTQPQPHGRQISSVRLEDEHPDCRSGLTVWHGVWDAPWHSAEKSSRSDVYILRLDFSSVAAIDSFLTLLLVGMHRHERWLVGVELVALQVSRKECMTLWLLNLTWWPFWETEITSFIDQVTSLTFYGVLLCYTICNNDATMSYVSAAKKLICIIAKCDKWIHTFSVQPWNCSDILIFWRSCMDVILVLTVSRKCTSFPNGVGIVNNSATKQVHTPLFCTLSEALPSIITDVIGWNPRSH